MTTLLGLALVLAILTVAAAIALHGGLVALGAADPFTRRTVLVWFGLLGATLLMGLVASVASAAGGA